MTRTLLIETSSRSSLVALADDGVLAERRLDESRRNARDLAPTIKQLLDGAGWLPRSLECIAAGVGPGSYTGLRVGLMTAKALAHALGCRLVGVETFAVLAVQAPLECRRVAVLGDAQKENVYVQTYERGGKGMLPIDTLAIRPLGEWLASRSPDTWATGPALARFRLDGVPLTTSETWQPGAAAMLALLGRRADDPITLAPLYVRPSSAEQQWAALGR